MKKPLTARQAEMLEVVRDIMRVRGRYPTIREIGDRMGIGSPNGVIVSLKALKRKGYMRHEARASRGWSIIEDDGCCPMCGQKILETSPPT